MVQADAVNLVAELTFVNSNSKKKLYRLQQCRIKFKKLNIILNARLSFICHPQTTMRNVRKMSNFTAFK